jgi:hypothetical protein
MPCHHNPEEYLTAYLDGTDLRGDPKGPLFRTISRRTGKVTRTMLPQANPYAVCCCRRHCHEARQSQFRDDRDLKTALRWRREKAAAMANMRRRGRHGFTIPGATK